MSVKEYLTNIGHAVLNKKEYFVNPTTTDASGTVLINSEGAQQLGTVVAESFGVMVLVIILGSILIFFNMYGAARTAYCHTKYFGGSDGMAIGYSVLAVVFLQVFYPIYAVFFNPLCGLTKPVGGKR